MGARDTRGLARLVRYSHGPWRTLQMGPGEGGKNPPLGRHRQGVCLLCATRFNVKKEGGPPFAFDVKKGEGKLLPS
jgi:hypothetical protein